MTYSPIYLIENNEIERAETLLKQVAAGEKIISQEKIIELALEIAEEAKNQNKRYRQSLEVEISGLCLDIKWHNRHKVKNFRLKTICLDFSKLERFYIENINKIHSSLENQIQESMLTCLNEIISICSKQKNSPNLDTYQKFLNRYKTLFKK